MPRSAKHLRGEVKPSKFKTSMCQYFIKDSECPFGDKCAFAHGDTELRSEQQNLVIHYLDHLISSDDSDSSA
ncbi:zinc finger protein, putative [Bodo saltans]|uniref:Zinc finger protein, putative n=1 Tax=Bodo saltans TaxID=75058 RepID=A0A0S4ILP8_BODSA|nr:zinc finger protein, putative [Bodo saltans]|eukprot:CUE71011.1 zinc finger protein, putative [Bodo saltans]